MRIYHLWQTMRSSFWFLPALLVLAAILLASTLIAIDANVELPMEKRWPLLFGAGAGGSRGLLTAVAGSMITVAGVVFSITIVALSLTSSQYTSRVLRNFMRDRTNQVVLGVFVGIFAYCLVVLRVIREGDEGAFVPSLAVLMALILAFVGIGFLIFFIHHIAVSIQASSIIATAAKETIAAVDNLFPAGIGSAPVENDYDEQSLSSARVWTAVPATKTGYIESVGLDLLIQFASEHHSVLRMERDIGEFVVEGTTLISIADGQQPPAEMIDELNSIYVVSRHRTVEQDASFGIRQIVDIALKALSPGINDTTTAIMCLHYLTAIVVRLASREFPSRHRFHDDELRVITRSPSFGNLTGQAFDQIRQNASGNVMILVQMLDSLTVIATQTKCQKRTRPLEQQAAQIMKLAEQTISSTADLARVKDAAWPILLDRGSA